MPKKKHYLQNRKFAKIEPRNWRLKCRSLIWITRWAWLYPCFAWCSRWLETVHRRILYAMHDLGLKHMPNSGSQPRWSEKFSASIIRMAIRQSMNQWSAWLRSFQCATRSLMAKEILARLMEILRRYALYWSQARAISDEMLSDIDKDTVDFVDN